MRSTGADVARMRNSLAVSHSSRGVRVNVRYLFARHGDMPVDSDCTVSPHQLNCDNFFFGGSVDKVHHWRRLATGISFKVLVLVSIRPSQQPQYQTKTKAWKNWLKTASRKDTPSLGLTAQLQLQTRRTKFYIRIPTGLRQRLNEGRLGLNPPYFGFSHSLLDCEPIMLNTSRSRLE